MAVPVAKYSPSESHRPLPSSVFVGIGGRRGAAQQIDGETERHDDEPLPHDRLIVAFGYGAYDDDFALFLLPLETHTHVVLNVFRSPPIKREIPSAAVTTSMAFYTSNILLHAAPLNSNISQFPSKEN